MRANRIDDNQQAIVAALRMIGASVQPLNAVRAGCPDLLVGFRGQNYLLEIKDGAKSASRRALTDSEAIWHSAWRGSVATVIDTDTALQAIGAKE